jgi:hypothetical protein
LSPADGAAATWNEMEIRGMKGDDGGMDVRRRFAKRLAML